MSTIDPAAVRRERLDRQRGSAGTLAAAFVATVLLATSGALFATGLATVLDQSRIVALNSVTSDWTPAFPLEWIAGIPLGIVLGAIAAVVALSRWRAYAGPRRRPPIGVATVWFAGAAIAGWLLLPSWSVPDVVGARVDATLGDEAWGAVDGVQYAFPWILPGAATLLAVLALVVGTRARARARSRDAVLDVLLVSGRRTPGVVTAAPVPTGEAERIAGSWTVRFTDAFGTERWTTRVSGFPVAEVPQVGDAVTVLYDVAAPGDEGRIFVATSGGDHADDYRRMLE